MPDKTVLVVDDEKNIRILLRDFLELEGYGVAEAGDGKEALEVIKTMSSRLDLIILDVMLPFLDGYTVCREIKKNYDIPVIMLTARNDDIDEAHGFDIGADDYVTKPIKPTALIARIKKFFASREAKSGGGLVLSFGGLTVDDASHVVTADGAVIALSPKEYELLVLLLRNKGKVISRETLMNEVWGYDYFGGLRTVDTHINRLRIKLGGQSERIVTIRGFGYKFE